VICALVAAAVQTNQADTVAAEIVELAAATADGVTFPLRSGESLIRPFGAVNSFASKAHGLVNANLLDAPCASVVMLQWVMWLTQQCQATPGGSCTLVLVGHNAAS
jgi:hypothetical protein